MRCTPVCERSVWAKQRGSASRSQRHKHANLCKRRTKIKPNVEHVSTTHTPTERRAQKCIDFLIWYTSVEKSWMNIARCRTKTEIYYSNFFIFDNSTFGMLISYSIWLGFFLTFIACTSARWKWKILLSIHYSSYAKRNGTTNVACFVWAKLCPSIWPCETIWRRFHFSNGKLTNMLVMEKWSRQSLRSTHNFWRVVCERFGFVDANAIRRIYSMRDERASKLLWMLSTSISVFHLANQSVSCPFQCI